MPIRIVITDDHPVVLKGLGQLCREEPDIEVVAECSDASTTLAAVRRWKPDLLLLDLHLPGRNGLDVMRELHSTADATAVVLLTASINEDEVIAAMRLGVRGVVLKDMAPSLLIQCIRKVVAGGQWIEKESIGRALEKMFRQEEAAQKVRATLTVRELEVMKLVVEGLSNAAAAERLCVTEGTIKTHLHTIYDKLDVRGRVQLMLFARENGLV